METAEPEHTDGAEPLHRNNGGNFLWVGHLFACDCANGFGLALLACPCRQGNQKRVQGASRWACHVSEERPKSTSQSEVSFWAAPAGA